MCLETFPIPSNHCHLFKSGFSFFVFPGFAAGINSKRSLKRVGASGPLYLSSQLIYILNLKDQHSRNDLNMIMTDNDEAC